MTGRAPRLWLPADPRAAARRCLEQPPPRGDGDELRRAAAAFARTAQTVRDALASLRSVGELGGAWTGPAASAFTAALREPSRARLDDVPARFEGYALALRAYADAFDGARVELAAARQRLADLLAADTAARAAAGPGGAARPPEPPAPLVPAALPRPAHGPTEEDFRAAVGAFAAAHERWAAAVDRCTAALARVGTHDSLRNPHGWHAVVDAVSTGAGDLSTIAAVLGVVGLAACPPLSAALFLASTVSGAVALGADVDRAAQFGDGVTTADLAADALGVLPVVGVAHGVVAGARAARAGQAVGRAVAGPVLTELTDAVKDGVAGLANPRFALPKPARPTWSSTGTVLQKHGQTLLGVPVGYAASAADDPGLSPWQHLSAPYRKVVDDLTGSTG